MQDGLRIEAPVVDLHLAQGFAHDAELIGLIVDRKAGAVAERRALALQDLEAERMERGERELLDRLGADQPLGALAHLIGGLVGERHGEDGFGRHALGEQIGDAIGDDAGLARAGAGEDEERSVEGRDGFALRAV